jgi:hypothetical protein
MLRVDGVKIYGPLTTRRRLEESGRIDNVDEHEHERGDTSTPTTPTSPRTNEYDSSVQARLATSMLNLTKKVCRTRVSEPVVALETRREAAIMWARLDDDTMNSSCFDCVKMVNSSCYTWFAHDYGLSNEVGPEAERTRRLRAQLEEDRVERTRRLEEMLDSACCRRNKRNGVVDCSRQYCVHAMKHASNKRRAHVLRRLHDKGHVKLDVAQQIAIDTLAPHLHPDEKCRPVNKDGVRGGGMSDAECFTRSVLEHIGKKHGIDASSVDRELSRFGLSVAEILAKPMAHGVSSNYRSDPAFETFASKYHKNRERIRRVATESGSDEHDDRDDHDSNAYVARRRTRSLPNVAKNWLNNASEFAKRVSQSAKRRYANTLDARPSSITGIMPHSERVTRRISVAVSANGGIINTLSTSVSSVGNVFKRATDAIDDVNRINTKTMANKSSSSQPTHTTAVNTYFQNVQRMYLKNHRHGRMNLSDTTSRRRLRQHQHDLTTQASQQMHTHWLVGLVDWRSVVSTVHDVADSLQRRNEHVWTYVQNYNRLPGGALHADHKTGIPFLDINVPPSKTGNVFREMFDMMTGRRHAGTRQERARQMHDTLLLERGGSRVGVLQTAFESAISGNDVFVAIQNAFENHDHVSTQSSIRRLGDSFLGSAARIPITPSFVANKYSVYEETKEDVNLFKETIRYIVYDVILCYLYAPDERDGGEFNDGSRITTHRTRRACFPVIPFAPSKMMSFKEYFGIQDVDFHSLEFEEACRADSVKGVFEYFPHDSISDQDLHWPLIAGILRFAEARDAVRNLMPTSGNLTATQRGAHLVCGIAQLGGVFFSAFVIVMFLGIACCCCPIGGALAFSAYRVINTTQDLAWNDKNESGTNEENASLIRVNDNRSLEIKRSATLPSDHRYSG